MVQTLILFSQYLSLNLSNLITLLKYLVEKRSRCSYSAYTPNTTVTKKGDEMTTFFYHADDELFNKWSQTGGTMPLVVDLLDMPAYEADKHHEIETDNPFEAFH